MFFLTFLEAISELSKRFTPLRRGVGKLPTAIFSVCVLVVVHLYHPSDKHNMRRLLGQKQVADQKMLVTGVETETRRTKSSISCCGRSVALLVTRQRCIGRHRTKGDC